MLVCDLHEDEVEGEETIAFGLDGTSYEIDVCEEHASEMRDAFAPYVGSARRAGRAGRTVGTSQRRSGLRAVRATAPSASASGNKERVQDIREWARQNGHQVSDRGRLSAAVVSAYEAAH